MKFEYGGEVVANGQVVNALYIYLHSTVCSFNKWLFIRIKLISLSETSKHTSTILIHVAYVIVGWIRRVGQIRDLKSTSPSTMQGGEDYTINKLYLADRKNEETVQ